MVAIIVHIVCSNFFANFFEALWWDGSFFLTKMMEKETLFENFYKLEFDNKMFSFADANLESKWECAMARASTSWSAEVDTSNNNDDEEEDVASQWHLEKIRI